MPPPAEPNSLRVVRTAAGEEFVSGGGPAAHILRRPALAKKKTGSRKAKSPRYSRIMLKISGEMLGGKSGKGIDPSSLTGFCKEILEVSELGVEVAMVVGGGNVIRGQKASRESGLLSRATADYMGMLATLINALALQDALESMGAPTRVMSAIEARAVCETYIRRRAQRQHEEGIQQGL